MTKKRTKPQAAKRSTAEQIDAELAAAAINKRGRGEKPSREELAALRRHEAAEEETRRWEYYSSIPKKHMRELSGRATEQLHRLADSLGAPVRGRTIDLASLLQWVFRFIENHKGEPDDPGDSPPELERLRKAQAEKFEMANAIKRGELRSLDEVRRTYDFAAATYRKAQAELRSEFGDRAAAIVEEAINQANELLEKFSKDGN